MANPEHLKILKRGAVEWNSWRATSHDIPDLSEASLNGVVLAGANLAGANFRMAKLSEAHFEEADMTGAALDWANLGAARLEYAMLSKASLFYAELSGACLQEANLAGATLKNATMWHANLRKANLTGADLREADFTCADLTCAILNQANFSRANLTEATMERACLAAADLTSAALVGTNLAHADLTHCRVYGLSVWDARLEGAEQAGLVITPSDLAEITVDNLEVAQFIYLLLNNDKIRKVIDSITSKVVLILGRFSSERKPILDALRNALRGLNYSPVVFDFEKPTSRNLTETVSTLAHMARFVIADITDAKSIAQELQRIVPDLPSVPVQPLLLASQQEYGMFDDLLDYKWVLKPIFYDNQDRLVSGVLQLVAAAEGKAKEMIEARQLRRRPQ